MSAPVDVLAAMEMADAWLNEEGYNMKSRRPLKESIAAVAELIRASDAMLLALYQQRSPTDEYFDLQNAVNAMGKAP